MYGFSGKGHFKSSSVFVKNTNFLLENTSYWCDNISGRHITYVEDNRKVISEQRYNNFSFTQLGLAIKSAVVLVQQIEFLDLEIDSGEMKLFLLQRNVWEIVQMSQNAVEGTLTLTLYRVKLPYGN